MVRTYIDIEHITLWQICIWYLICKENIGIHSSHQNNIIFFTYSQTQNCVSLTHIIVI